MLVLAIETATERASVALVQTGIERAAWHSVTSEDLCRCLAPEVGGVIARGKAAFPQLDLIAVGLGPGSFTSLRIGLATAKAIALAHDLPLVGASSLAAMAWQMRDTVDGLLCPALDARRGDLYAAIYRASNGGIEQVTAEFLATPDALAAVLKEQAAPVAIFGRLPPAAVEQIKQAGGNAVDMIAAPVLPSAQAVAELGRQRFESRGADDLAALRPIYIRKSYAEEAFDIDLRLC
jgi:tRNA threonylcarbamoyladenosine biosynthesis protein TsaB